MDADLKTRENSELAETALKRSVTPLAETIDAEFKLIDTNQQQDPEAIVKPLEIGATDVDGFVIIGLGSRR
jgi:hypothetical protein